MHPCALLGVGRTHGVARDAPWPKIKVLGMLAKPNARLHFARNTGQYILVDSIFRLISFGLNLARVDHAFCTDERVAAPPMKPVCSGHMRNKTYS